MLPKVIGSQKTLKIVILPRSGKLSTESLCLFSGTLKFLAVICQDSYVLIYLCIIFLCTSSIQDTGHTVYKASFLKAVLYSNGRNETYIGYLRLKQEVNHAIKEIKKIKLNERDHFQLGKEQVRFSAKKTLGIYDKNI